MTIYSKTELEGIDNRIYRIQRDLNNRIEWSNFDIYGRLYISDDGKFKIANAYTSDGEHKDIFFDDKKTAIIGFIVDDNRDGINISVVPVNIICSCKIDKIYNSGNMNDENIIQSLLSVISRHTHSQSKSKHGKNIPFTPILVRGM